MIVFIVREVNRATAHLDAHRQGAFVNVPSMKPFAAERRYQRRMNVHHPAHEVRRNLHQLQKAAHAHQVGPVGAAGVEDALTELRPRRALLPLNNGRWNARDLGAHEAERFDLARHDAHDLGVESPVGDAVEEILQRRAAAAEENGDSDRIHQALLRG